jgi:hypothetical protein
MKDTDALKKSRAGVFGLPSFIGSPHLLNRVRCILQYPKDSCLVLHPGIVQVLCFTSQLPWVNGTLRTMSGDTNP